MIRKLFDLIGRFFRWLGGLMLDCVSSNPQISIDVDTLNLNLADLIAAQNMPCGNVDIVIQEGVKVGSDDAANPAIETGDLAGYTVRVINRGEIYGAGGQGGNGVYKGAGNPGEDGGTCVKATSVMALINRGIMEGGGGGGGAGGGEAYASGPVSAYGAGGAGGGGCGLEGGPGGTYYRTGGAATFTEPGEGALGQKLEGTISDTRYAGYGGAGGNRGEAGEPGLYGHFGSRAPGAGGLAGYYIDGIANVQFQNNGTVLGRVT